MATRTCIACLVAVMSTGCGSSAEAGAAYQHAGPYATGVTTVSLPDRDVEIWYPVKRADVKGRERDVYFLRDWVSTTVDALLPAELNPPFVTNAYRDAPASDRGPFPLVVFAHGSGGFRTQSTMITTHIASWGFVVVAPDYLEFGLGTVFGTAPDPPLGSDEVSRMAIDLAKAENVRPGGLLEGRIAADEVAITGHSAGGGVATRFGAQPDVVTYIPLSAGSFGESSAPLPDKPSMWLTGEIDGIVELARVEQAFEAAPSPTRLVVLANGGHLAPADICNIGASGGGVVALALEAGLPVPEGLQRTGTDGCQDDALPVELGWPVFNHFITAHLRAVFGIDAEAVDLTQNVLDDFPDAPFTYRER